jgi:hypothetical protein
MLKPNKRDRFHKKYYCIFILLLQISTICYAQQKKLNLSFNETSITDAIKEISRQSKINILYNPNILPENFNITGAYKNITIGQALDSVLRNTHVHYKYFKNDIVLYKKNEVIIEKHNVNKPVYPKESQPEKKYVYVTDTITYSIITSDTIVTKVTNIVNVPVMDTIKVYDTVKVIKQVNMPVNTYKPKKKAFITGWSLSQGLAHFTKGTVHEGISYQYPDSSSEINLALKEKSSNAISFHFLYRYKSWIFETGLGFYRQKFTTNLSSIVNGWVNRTDTIDKYYTDINGTDTTWVYITEVRKVEVSMEKNTSSDLTYQYISLPLFAGYSKNYKKLTLEFKGGVFIKYYLGSKGLYLTKTPEGGVTTENKKAPETKFNIDLCGAITADYFLNEKFHIFVQPYIGYTAFAPGVKRIPNYYIQLQIEIQTGLRYYF